MKGAMSMYDYRGKIGGVIGSAISLAAMVAERLHGFIIFKKFSVAQHYAIFEWLMLGSLFVIIYSKEKHEDDRAKMIRAKSFQLAFMLQSAVLLSMALVGTIGKGGMTLIPSDLFMFAAMGIVLYLLVFHIGLYFDFLWDYNDTGFWENLKNLGKNKWGLLVYFAMSAVLLLLLSLLQ